MAMEVVEAVPEASGDVVKEGEWVLVVDNETRYSFCVARGDATVRLGKKACSCRALIGAPYGSYFEAINGKLFRSDPFAHKEANEALVGDELVGTAAVDNRDLHDRNDTQTLSQAEIKTMQEEGKKAELVRKLAEGSASFAKRTGYSQEKYLRKKTQKHRVVIQIVRPTSALICRAYFHKKPFRIQNMRPDTLAHIATLANLQCGTRTLVIDECIGLIAGLALERAAGIGAVYNLHQGGDCNPSALRLYNFSSAQLKCLKHVPIALLQGTMSVQNFNLEETSEVGMDVDVGAEDALDELDANEGEKAQKLAKRIDPKDLPPKRSKREHVPLKEILAREVAEGVTAEESAERRRKNNEMRQMYRELKWQNLSDSKKELETRGVDALLIAGPAHPLNALNSTWRFLTLSGAFVLYSEFLQPLVECYQALYESGCVINMRLTETWHRNYQVLPKRTHPLMNMSAASGYLLSGIKVEQVAALSPNAPRLSTPSSDANQIATSSSSPSESGEPPKKKARYH